MLQGLQQQGVACTGVATDKGDLNQLAGGTEVKHGIGIGLAEEGELGRREAQLRMQQQRSAIKSREWRCRGHRKAGVSFNLGAALGIDCALTLRGISIVELISKVKLR